MNTRVQKFIEGEGLTAARFADMIGVQRSNVSHVLSGRNKPSYDFIEKMLGKFSELNAEWLILGKGTMYKESHTPSLFGNSLIDIGIGKVSEEDAPEYKTARSRQVNSISSLEPDKKDTTEKIVSSGKKLVRVLLCYSDGSFEIFDSNSISNQ